MGIAARLCNILWLDSDKVGRRRNRGIQVREFIFKNDVNTTGEYIYDQDDLLAEFLGIKVYWYSGIRK